MPEANTHSQVIHGILGVPGHAAALGLRFDHPFFNVPQEERLRCSSLDSERGPRLGSWNQRVVH